MKLKEDIVDLAAKRKQKRLEQLPVIMQRVKKGLNDHNQMEQESMTAFGQLQKAFEEQRKSARVPGFESFADLTYYLVVDLGMPTQQASTQKWKRWFGSLEHRDQLTVKMISSHAERIFSILKKQQAQLEAFKEEWTAPYRNKIILSPLDVYQQISYLQRELQDDLTAFVSLYNLTKLLQ